jgi:hypothetical protein
LGVKERVPRVIIHQQTQSRALSLSQTLPTTPPNPLSPLLREMSAASEVVLPNNIDITKITYGVPKQMQTGAKTIFIAYAGKQFYAQTPEMKAPFGISMWPSDNGGPDKYSLDLSFEGCDTRPQLKMFFDALKAIDKKLVVDAMENSQAWFKKKYPSVDVVEALYSPTVRYNKDRETGEVNDRYAPTFKMSLPMKDGKFQFPAYGTGREELDLFDIVAKGNSKGVRAQAIVQLSAIWLVGNKFGCMWKVRQLRLSEPARLSAYAFQSTGEEELLESEAAREAAAAGGDDAVPVVRRLPAAPAKKAAAPSDVPQFVESSDEGDDGL